MREIVGMLAVAALAGCASEDPCEKILAWTQNQNNVACANGGLLFSPPWVPQNCAAGLAQCNSSDRAAVDKYANCLPNCPSPNPSFLQAGFWSDHVTLCEAELGLSQQCATALSQPAGGSTSGSGSGSGSNGSSGGGSTGSGSTGFGNGSGSSSAGSSSSGGSSTTGGGSSGGGSSSGGTSGCAAYGSSCAGGQPCCGGLSCDATSAVCLVADGQPCPGESCASPDVCYPSGVCGACLSQNSACTTGGEPCCSGLTCRKTNGNKYACL